MTLDDPHSDDLTLREFFEARFDGLEKGQERIEGESITRLERVEKKVDTAVTQVRITNGRVSELEKFKAQIRAIVVIGVLILPYVLDRLIL